MIIFLRRQDAFRLCGIPGEVRWLEFGTTSEGMGELYQADRRRSNFDDGECVVISSHGGGFAGRTGTFCTSNP